MMIAKHPQQGMNDMQIFYFGYRNIYSFQRTVLLTLTSFKTNLQGG
jgi:hypothetical protein